MKEAAVAVRGPSCAATWCKGRRTAHGLGRTGGDGAVAAATIVNAVAAAPARRAAAAARPLWAHPRARAPSRRPQRVARP